MSAEGVFVSSHKAFSGLMALNVTTIHWIRAVCPVLWDKCFEYVCSFLIHTSMLTMRRMFWAHSWMRKLSIKNVKMLNHLPGFAKLLKSGNQGMIPKHPLCQDTKLWVSCSWVLPIKQEVQKLGIDPARAGKWSHSSWETHWLFWEKYISEFLFWGLDKSYQFPGPLLSHLWNGRISPLFTCLLRHHRR